jgi:hypothetical protein
MDPAQHPHAVEEFSPCAHVLAADERLDLDQPGGCGDEWTPISRRPGLGEREPCGTKSGPDGLDPFQTLLHHPGSIDTSHVPQFSLREQQVQVR